MAVSDLQRRFHNTLNRSSQVFIRSESIDMSGPTFPIIGVDTSANVFKVSGDQTGEPTLTEGNKVYGINTTANNAIFEISSVSTDGSGDTAISVVESIKDATVDGELATKVNYEYVNAGRVKNASVESDLVQSDMDQDGRTSTKLFGFTASFALQQGTNEELSILPDLTRPKLGGNRSLYNRGYNLYNNGHFVYFSGDSQVTTAMVNNAILDSNVSAQNGELLTTDPTKDLSDDRNGILFQNVLLSSEASFDLSGGESIIPVEFEGETKLSALRSLNHDRKILVSISDFFEYA